MCGMVSVARGLIAVAVRTHEATSSPRLLQGADPTLATHREDGPHLVHLILPALDDVEQLPLVVDLVLARCLHLSLSCATRSSCL
eukprot:CAMPEP_0119075036 /NCGR_PEP_ID=MMETSP1178-20130426/76138_1 /TAXON_ID=33656 /ORGANISM="unid sp, Strain CCMP2000" /LENGTH=84 /DNA_ID=CAMNT_0007057233 /DNA_START=22 /DNA_END=272 /DNA_ORIENTATION=+